MEQVTEQRPFAVRFGWGGEDLAVLAPASPAVEDLELGGLAMSLGLLAGLFGRAAGRETSWGCLRC